METFRRPCLRSNSSQLPANCSSIRGNVMARSFWGTVVGLGAVGVITKVTLDIQPTFLMQQYVYENLPLSELVHNFDAIESSAYSVSLFTDWQKQRINEVWIKSRLEPGRPFQAVPAFFGAKLASKNMHPIAELSPENCTEQLGVPGPWYERLPHFRMGFSLTRNEAIAQNRSPKASHTPDLRKGLNSSS